MGATARAAGAILTRLQGTDLKVKLKPDASLVTDADLQSDRCVVSAINQAFPDDLIYSEESGLSSTDRQPGRAIWIIDPLDGTTNFANGYPFYSVSIGRGVFNAEGKIDLTHGAIFDPCRDVLYYAERGAGAFANGERLAVAAPRELSRCFLVTGFYYMKGDVLKREIARFAKVAQKCQSIRRDGSAALDLAFVAAGVYDGFWEHGLQPWDVAAGIVLVEEAGGQVVNYPVQGRALPPYDLNGSGLIAGTPGLTKDLIGIL